MEKRGLNICFFVKRCESSAGRNRAEANNNLLKARERQMYENKTLVCEDCKNEFIFTAEEQEFYASKGFQNEPKRCRACRDARKNAQRPQREYFTTTCARCGKEARVPFQPTSDRPVYCSDCFAAMKEEQ